MTSHQQEYEIDKKGDIPSIGVNDVDNLSTVEPVEPSKFKRIYRSALVSSASPLAPTQPLKLTISTPACPYSSRWCALFSVGFEPIALLTPSPTPGSPSDSALSAPSLSPGQPWPTPSVVSEEEVRLLVSEGLHAQVADPYSYAPQAPRFLGRSTLRLRPVT